MKRTGLILALMMTLVFTGCSFQGDSVDEAEKKVEAGAQNGYNCKTL